MVRLTPYNKDVIVGLLLSDGWLTIATKRSKNARLGFKQSLAHSGYVWFVFNILSQGPSFSFEKEGPCSSLPQLTQSTRLGNKHYGLQFFTRSLPCFTSLHTLFYPEGVKVVPKNIYDLLTPIALAHLIMGDGRALSHGLTICTNSYTVQDVVVIINVLIVRYGLECNIRECGWNKKLEHMIFIKQRSMPLLRTLVKPYMHSSMLYKLG